MATRRWLVWCLAALPAWSAPLTGSLADATGQPVGGATVWLLSERGDQGWAATRAATLADGRFAFDAPSGRTPSALVARVPGRGFALTQPAVDGAALRLEPGDDLAGQVLGPLRQPLAEATVSLTALTGYDGIVQFAPSAAADLWSTRTGADGVWRLSDVPRRRWRQIEIAAAAHTWTKATIGPGWQMAPANIAILQPACTLRGHLLGADGRPASGERLALAVTGPWPVGRECVVTGAQGEFAFAHAPIGAEATISPALSASVRQPPVRLWTGKAADLDCGPLRLPAVGHVVGTLVDEAGQPEPHRPVLLSGAVGRLHGLTDASGRFDLAGFAGDYQLTVSEPAESVQQPVTLRAGATTTLRPVSVHRATQHLRICAADGRLLAAHDVWVSGAAGPALRQTTDSDGLATIRFGMVRSQQLRVVSVAPYASGEATLGAAADRLELRLTAGQRPQDRTGTLLDERGSPAAGVRIEFDCFWPTAATALLTSTTDGRGRWALAGVPFDWLLTGRITSPGWRATSFRCSGAAEAPAVTVQRLSGQVTGRVVDAARRPVAGVPVFVEGDWRDPPALTDAEGRFACTQLPAGTVSLVALRGRRELARVVCQSPSADRVLTLGEPELPPSRPEPSEAELELAHRLIGAALDADAVAEPRWLGLLARLDAGEALERIAWANRRRARDTLAPLLAAAGPGVVFPARLTRFVAEVPGDPARIVAARLASDHLPPADGAAQAELLRTVTAISPPVRALDRLRWAETAAVLTSRTSEPDDRVLTAFVQAWRDCPKANGGGDAYLRDHPLPPALIDALTPLVKDSLALSQGRCLSLRHELRRDAEAALAAARRWWPGAGPWPAWPSSPPLDRASVLGLARALAKTDRLPPDDLPRLVAWAGLEPLTAAALRCESADAAKPYLSLAAEPALPTGRSWLGPGMGEALLRCRLEPLDAAAADLAWQEALGDWTFNPLGSRLGDDGRRLQPEQCLARVDPNRVRWAAETVLTDPAPVAATTLAAVRLLAAVDLRRAEAAAGSFGPASDEAAALVDWLLGDRGDRAGGCSWPEADWGAMLGAK